jgi:hypothetical protein
MADAPSTKVSPFERAETLTTEAGKLRNASAPDAEITLATAAAVTAWLEVPADELTDAHREWVRSNVRSTLEAHKLTAQRVKETDGRLDSLRAQVKDTAKVLDKARKDEKARTVNVIFVAWSTIMVHKIMSGTAFAEATDTPKSVVSKWVATGKARAKLGVSSVERTHQLHQLLVNSGTPVAQATRSALDAKDASYDKVVAAANAVKAQSESGSGRARPSTGSIEDLDVGAQAHAYAVKLTNCLNTLATAKPAGLVSDRGEITGASVMRALGSAVGAYIRRAGLEDLGHLTNGPAPAPAPRKGVPVKDLPVPHAQRKPAARKPKATAPATA